MKYVLIIANLCMLIWMLSVFNYRYNNMIKVILEEQTQIGRMEQKIHRYINHQPEIYIELLEEYKIKQKQRLDNHFLKLQNQAKFTLCAGLLLLINAVFIFRNNKLKKTEQ